MAAKTPDRMSHARDAVTQMAHRDLDAIIARGGRMGAVAAVALKEVSDEVARPLAVPPPPRRRWLTATITATAVGLTAAAATGLMIYTDQARQSATAQRLTAALEQCQTAYGDLDAVHTDSGATYRQLVDRGVLRESILTPVQSDLANAKNVLATDCPTPGVDVDPTDALLATSEHTLALTTLSDTLSQEVARATDAETSALRQEARSTLEDALGTFNTLSGRSTAALVAAADLEVTTTATDQALKDADAVAEAAHGLLEDPAADLAILDETTADLTSHTNTLDTALKDLVDATTAAATKRDAAILAAQQAPNADTPATGANAGTKSTTSPTTATNAAPKADTATAGTAPAKTKAKAAPAQEPPGVRSMYFNASSGSGEVTITATATTGAPTPITATVTVSGKSTKLNGPATLDGDGTYTATLTGLPAGEHAVTVTVGGLSDSSTIRVF